ncbi:MAG: xanthine dehydrogenase family protein subunit M [Candidatus Riflebacteria bacterium]|nr:xanthine dehydrogenase family protein subunit M [Candidatus Riflebacteria bacterium]
MHGEFSYCAPSDSEELSRMLNKFGVEGQILAGGTDLLVNIRSGISKPKVLIDIKKIPEFNQIAFDERDGLIIGPTVTCADVIRNPLIAEKFPLIKECAQRLGSPQLRNRATVAGNLCAASPCADMATALLCLDASIIITSPDGSRSIKLKNFFTGVKTTVLKPEEYLEKIIVPNSWVNARGAFEKLKRIKGHDMALVSVAIAKTEALIKIAIGSCAPTPIVLHDFPADVEISKVWELAQKAIKPIDDLRASAEYRSVMVKTFIERVMKRVN